MARSTRRAKQPILIAVAGNEVSGILDRLERGVLVRAVRDRYPDLMRLYAGMNRSMNQIYARYNESELELVADFLHRTANAGRSATDELSDN